jgi:hypothetical protein
VPPIDDPAVKPPPLPPEEVEEVIDGFQPLHQAGAHKTDPAAQGPVDQPVAAAEVALGEVGHFLTDAGERIADLDRLFADATRPFRELEGLLAEARGAFDAAAAAAEHVADLERELEQARAETEELRTTSEHAQGAVDEAQQQREKSEALAAEAESRIEELERELREERDRATKLEGSLAHAEMSIATSAQEANSARKRAEAARLEAEAARLEALAARQDAESAQLEAETFLQDAGSARSEADRLRRAAQAALEHMQTVQSEWGPDHIGTPWLEEMLDLTGQSELATDAAKPELESEDRFQAEAQAGYADDDAQSADDEDAYAEPGGEDSSATADLDTPDDGEESEDAEDAEAWSESEDNTAADDEPEPEADESEPSGPVSPLAWSHSAKLALTAVIVDAGTPSNLMEGAVRVMGSRGGWDMVIAWQLDPKSDCWVCTEMWSARPDDAESLEKSIKQLKLDNESPIARAAVDGRLGWLGGVDAGTRAGLAVLEGEQLQSIVVLPLVHEGQAIGVIVLCSRHEGPPSEDLRIALEAIAVEVAGTYQAVEAVAGPDGPRWTKWRRR